MYSLAEWPTHGALFLLARETCAFTGFDARKLQLEIISRQFVAARTPAFDAAGERAATDRRISVLPVATFPEIKRKRRRSVEDVFVSQRGPREISPKRRSLL